MHTLIAHAYTAGPLMSLHDRLASFIAQLDAVQPTDLPSSPQQQQPVHLCSLTTFFGGVEGDYASFSNFEKGITQGAS